MQQELSDRPNACANAPRLHLSRIHAVMKHTCMTTVHELSRESVLAKKWLGGRLTESRLYKDTFLCPSRCRYIPISLPLIIVAA